MNYAIENITIPQSDRANLNNKVLYLIESGAIHDSNITANDVFNIYTGPGGLHGLERKDFRDYDAYSEAKKEIEQGSFYTPHIACQFVVDCIRPKPTDIIYDLTYGMGNFFNWLPVESNIYGTELDTKAYKVAKFLYPDAHLSNEDIRVYQPPVKADIVFGNPPFHLKWKVGLSEYPSQLYFCLKAAEVLKPGGMMAVVVPQSFLKDEFFDKSSIEMIASHFSFITQFDLPDSLFNYLGVAQFGTKLMILQRKSQYLEDKPYSSEKIAVTDSEQVYTEYVKPLLDEKERLSGKLYFEYMRMPDDNKAFMEQVTKLLFDIKRNTNINHRFGECESYLNRYLTQKQPIMMSYAEWQKVRISEADVIQYLKKILSSANRVYRDEKKIVKTNYGFKWKDYSRAEDHSPIGSINNCVLYDMEVQPYQKLLDRKKRDYSLHQTKFDDIPADIEIEDELKKWSVYSKLEDRTIRLAPMQLLDVNRLIQKRYGILQYEQGAGKTVCGLALVEYLMKHRHMRNAFIVSDAIAINMTWDVVLKDYGIDYIRINKLKDIDRIQEKQIVIITLEMLVKYQKQLKKFVKQQNQKVALYLDESDMASNIDAKRTRAVLNVFRKTKYTYDATGTTSKNNIREFYTQLELLYNNSINMLCACERITVTDEKGEQEDHSNPYYMLPYPPYRKGQKLFAESHMPTKITVFGMDKATQDIQNGQILKDLLSRTVITRTMEEVLGRKIHDVTHVPVKFSDAEKEQYKYIIEEFHTIRHQFFKKQDSPKKDSMFRVLQQLLLLLKFCADPSLVTGNEFNPTYPSEKIEKVLTMIGEWPLERVAVGVRNKDVLNSYKRHIQSRFPSRPLFVIHGGMSFKSRLKIIEILQQTNNGILLSTQQSLSKSANIDCVNKVILVQLHYNDSAMSQYYKRFVRYTSTVFKKIYYVTYEQSIENNLLKMVLMKERFNLFMRNEELELDALYDRFGADPEIINQLMFTDYDENGRVHVKCDWGEAETRMEAV